ncbi:MAG: peptidylprolyl isomerase [Myxococcota bacterium]|nr:peptidylprolyl isomerase [Myxococcota bacterium]
MRTPHFLRQGPALFLLALALMACSTQASPPSAPADLGLSPSEDLVGKHFGSVNGMPMGFTEFDQVAARRGAVGGNLDSETRQEITDGLVDEKLLYLKAREEGVDLDPKIQRMVVNTFLKNHVYVEVRETNPTEEELMAYYEEHKEDFVVPEKRQVKRILVKARDGEDAGAVAARVAQVRAELDGPGLKDWDALTARHSDGPYASRGGDLGYVGIAGRPGVDPAVIAKAFSLDGAGLSDVFETREGLNIVHVSGIRKRVERSFRQIRGAVSRKAKAERYKGAYESYVASLRLGADIQVNQSAVDAHEVAGGRRLRPIKPKKGSLPGSSGNEAPTLPADPKEAAGHTEGQGK